MYVCVCVYGGVGVMKSKTFGQIVENQQILQCSLHEKMTIRGR